MRASINVFKTILFSIVLLAATIPANAAIIIQVESKNLAAGGLGFVDVFVSSDETTIDYLSSANYEFEIVPTGPNGDSFGELLFRPDADQSADEQTDPAYVFAGDNLGIVANRQDLAGYETRIIGSDLTSSGNNILLTAAPRLLARFEIFHNAPIPSLAIGDTFSIGLINNNQGNADPLDDSTFFSDNVLAPLPFASGSSPLAFANFGVITISSATAAVPEPGTFGVLAFAAVSLCGRRLRRKKSQLTPPSGETDLAR